jgi:hypothetical protein
MRYFTIVFLFIFSNKLCYSQKLYGIDFINNWNNAKTEFFNLGFTKKINQNVYFFEKRGQYSNDIYKYEFVFHSINLVEDAKSIFKSINDSISSGHGEQNLKIEKNPYPNITANNFFSKIFNKEIQYYSKWSSSSKWKYTIECEIKSDRSIQLTLIDSSLFKTKEEAERINKIKRLEEERINEIKRLEEETRIKNAAKERQKKVNELRVNIVKQGLAIIDYEAYDMSEYTDGTGFRIRLFNPTKKTIKYISISLYGINPVGDKVRAKFSDSFLNKVKCVGPIKPFEGSEYEWEYLWYNDLVETIKLVSISVQYMDGTIRNYNSFGSLTLNEDQIDLLEDLKINN